MFVTYDSAGSDSSTDGDASVVELALYGQCRF